jgi:ribosomal protein S18 acetylase RimI-like enzyme
MEDALLAHRNLIEFCREATRWGRGGQLREIDGVGLFATGSWVPSNCNGAYRLDDDVPGEEVLQRAEEFFTGMQRGYSIAVRETAADDDLRAACEAAELPHFNVVEPAMICRDLTAPDVGAVEIGTVDTSAGVDDFVRVNTDAYSYGMPPGEVAAYFSRPSRLLAAPHVATFVGYERGEPVSAAQMLLSDGIGGVYWVGTADAARRRGHGARLTAAATRAAFDRGARFVTLQASTEGMHVYEQLGYAEVYRYRRYVKIWRRPTRHRRWRR